MTTPNRFRFRAWDEETKVMLDYSWIADNCMREVFENEDLVVMQSTGLVDKNGTEIFEGDIVKLMCGGENGADTRHGILAEVEWLTRQFACVIPEKTVVVKGGSMDGKYATWREIHSWGGMHDCLGYGGSYVEVIGNVHENPELLTPQS